MQRSSKERVMAVLCSDIHLSHTPPVFRSNEPDWYAAMARPLHQLAEIATNLEVPIICAGDIFDRWNSPPELINFALRTLPKMFAIPGQHDLPYHDLNQIKKSAYWTLVEAGVVTNIEGFMELDQLRLWGFPWGAELRAKPWEDEDGVNSIMYDLAVIHRYVWEGHHKYEGAPDKANVSIALRKLNGYHAAVFGDNHKGFLTFDEHTTIFNCGGFMRRKSDELHYRPRIGLLLEGGDGYHSKRVRTVDLDCSEDKYLNISKDIKDVDSVSGLREYIKQLQRATTMSGLDFKTAMEQWVANECKNKHVARIIVELLEEIENGNPNPIP